MNLKARLNGSVATVVGEITIGVVVLFVGLFMLNSIDPIFAGRLTECSYVNTAPSAQLTLNGSVTNTGNMTFASATNVQGYCILALNVTNVSATSGSYLEVRVAGTNTLINNHTIPTTQSAFTSSRTITQSSGNWLANVTAFGGDNVTVGGTGSYLRCCSAITAKSTPAGQVYTPLTGTIATIFVVLGLILIVVGLASAIGSMKGMI